MPRVSDEVLEEIIENDGCRRGSTVPINSTGVVRLALDMQEARAELARLRAVVGQTSGLTRAVASALDREFERTREDRANKTTRLERGKRTKLKKKMKT